jgi:isopentenyldiphosphate isomerase
MPHVNIYNEDYSFAGTMPREQAQKESRWVKASHLWVINPKSASILFQKRSNNKKYFPGTLDMTAAGHYATGEELNAGMKEMANELGGVKVVYEDLIHLGIRHNIIPTPELTVRQFCHVFFLESERETTDYTLSPKTAEGLAVISIEEGLKLWANEKCTIEASFFGVKSKNEKIICISKEDFLPRIDLYYYKVFILAKHFLAGEKHLAI